MPVMDSCCFFSEPKAPILVMSSILINQTRPFYLEMVYRRVLHKHPKMTSSIVNVLGDLYYKPIEGGEDSVIKS